MCDGSKQTGVPRTEQRRQAWGATIGRGVGTHPSTHSSPCATPCMSFLAAARVITDARVDRLRFGFGLYHRAEDVEALVGRLAELGAAGD